MTKLQKVDDILRVVQNLCSNNQSDKCADKTHPLLFNSAAVCIKEVSKELRKLMDEQKADQEFIYKQVERGLFDKNCTPKQALRNISLLDSAPWNSDDWNWNVDHKEYAEEFYRNFPKAKELEDETE